MAAQGESTSDLEAGVAAAATAPHDSLAQADRRFEHRMLPHVSRTFALTIPELPVGLRDAVTSAYLVCRIADTLEDEPALDPELKQSLQGLFREVIEGHGSAARFAAQAYPCLTDATLAAERELVRESARVVRSVERLPVNQRDALRRCVTIMSEGMAHYQRNKSPHGLARLDDLKDYCYYVAGVVGEMLTELFCDYAADISARRDELMARAVAFGRGLQMTNILKDIWEDRAADTCWLPREVFARHGFDLDELGAGGQHPGFARGLRELVGVAHGYLRQALEYTQIVPARHAGIRRFCLWSIGLAVLTLRKIHDRPFFTAGDQVKVSRRAVRATIITSNLLARRDGALTRVFNMSARGLPLEDVSRDAAPAPG